MRSRVIRPPLLLRLLFSTLIIAVLPPAWRTDVTLARGVQGGVENSNVPGTVQVDVACVDAGDIKEYILT